MSLIVDASVAVKWFLEEPGSTQAEALLAGQEPLLAPDLILAEIGNALWKNTRRKLMSREQALSAVEMAPSYFDELTPTGELILQATRLALDLDHAAYDCFYLALATRNAAPLITADEKLFDAARRARIEARML